MANEASHRLSIVGIGPGDLDHMTIQATRVIKESDFVVGYRPYLELIQDLLANKQTVSGRMGKEVDRAKAAVDLLEDGSVALISSGDPNVYGMAGLGLELASRRSGLENVVVVPGVTSFAAAAGRAGVVFRDSVAVISLSDLLTPWACIKERVELAAEYHIPVALYNPRSRMRDWQLERCLETFSPDTDILIARNVARNEETLLWTKAGELLDQEELKSRIDMFTLLILDGDGVFRGEVTERSMINITGIGPGSCDMLTFEAKRLLHGSTRIFGAQRYKQAIKELSKGELVIHQGDCTERIAQRLQEARTASEKGQQTSILTGGDPSIFSSSWRIMDGAGEFKLHISSGVSAFSAVAARAGAPLVNDFVLLSGADNTSRIGRLAGAGFGVVVYNTAGQDLGMLLVDVEARRPCALARDVARVGESVLVMSSSELKDAKPSGSRFTLLVASAGSYIEDGKIITKRGYQTRHNY